MGKPWCPAGCGKSVLYHPNSKVHYCVRCNEMVDIKEDKTLGQFKEKTLKGEAMRKAYQRQILINDNYRKYLDPLSRRNKLTGFSKGNTHEHEAKKFEIAMNCVRDGLEVLIEPKLKNGKRPDVLVVDVTPPIAYEIAKSESDQSIEEKKKSYLGIIVKMVRI